MTFHCKKRWEFIKTATEAQAAMIKSLSAGLKLQYGLFLLVSKAESSLQELSSKEIL